MDVVTFTFIGLVAALGMLAIFLLRKFYPNHPLPLWANTISRWRLGNHGNAGLLQLQGDAERVPSNGSATFGRDSNTAADATPRGRLAPGVARRVDLAEVLIVNDMMIEMTPTAQPTTRSIDRDRPPERKHMTNEKGSDLLNGCIIEVVTKHITNFKQVYGSVGTELHSNPNNCIMSPVLLIYTLVQLACISKGDTKIEILNFLKCPMDRTGTMFHTRKYQEFIEKLVADIRASVVGQETTWDSLLLWFDTGSSPEMSKGLSEAIMLQNPATQIVRSDQANVNKAIQAMDIWKAWDQPLAFRQAEKTTASVAASRGGGLTLCASSADFLIGASIRLDEDDKAGANSVNALNAPSPGLSLSWLPFVKTKAATPPPSLYRSQLIRKFAFRDYSAPLTGMHKLTMREKAIKYTLAVPPYAREFRCRVERDSTMCSVANDDSGSIMCLEFPLASRGGDPFDLTDRLSMRIIMPFGKKGFFDIQPQQVANTFIAWDEIVRKNFVDPIISPGILMPMFNFAPTQSDFAHILRSCKILKTFSNQADFSGLFADTSAKGEQELEATTARTNWIHDLVQIATLRTDVTGNLPEGMEPDAFIEYCNKRKKPIIPISSAFYFAIMYRMPLDASEPSAAVDSGTGSKGKEKPRKPHRKAQPKKDDNRPQGYCIPIYTGCMTDPPEYIEPTRSE